MENSKHHIDQFLREQMQKMPVELNEAHWKDAERRLDEDDEKKRPFVLFFILGVLLVGLGTSAVKKLNNNKKTKQPIVKHDTGINPLKKQEVHKANQAEYTNQINTEQSVSQPARTTIDRISNTTPGAQTDLQTESSEESVGDQRSNRSEPLATVPTESQTTMNAVEVSSRGPRTAKHSQAVASSIEKNQMDNASVSSKTEHVQTNQTTVNGKNIEAERTLALQSNKTSTARKKAMAELPKKGDARSAQHTELPNTSNTGLREPQRKKVRIYRSPEEYQKMNPRYVSGLENYTFTSSALTPETADSIRAVADTKEKPAEVAKKSAPTPKPIFIQDPSSFFIMAGIAGARGYTGSGDMGRDYGLSPSLGLGYQFNFSERMSLYLSMYMSYLNHLNIRETGTNVSYSFDKDSTFISVTRKNLLQFHVPLQLAYKIRPKHTVFGGMGINLGLNTVSLYEDSKQSSSKKQFGYMNGIRFMDVNANLGYEYRLTPKLSLGIFYQRGFFDMTKNNYFNNQQIDQNARGGINLRYNFLR